MQKKDLLEDIQKKIDICNQYISENLYPPAQKRVGYVLNNKCKARDILFYLNAIYNEEQQRLNTSIDARKELEKEIKKDFTLAEVKPVDITIKLLDTITNQRQKFVQTEQKREVKTGQKNFWGKEKTETKTKKSSSWVDMVNDQNERFNSTYAEQTNSKQFTTVTEAVEYYKTLKDKIGTKQTITEEPNTVPNMKIRVVSTHKFSVVAQFNFKNYIDQIVEKTRIQNQGVKDTEGQPLLNWEYSRYIFTRGNGRPFTRFVPNQEIVDITKDIDQLTRKKVDTYVNNTSLNKIERKLSDINHYLDHYQEQYYEKYLRQFNLYKGQWGSSKKTSAKRKQAFKKVKREVEDLFEPIFEYEDRITVSALQNYIDKYNRLEQIQDDWDAGAPEMAKTVKKMEDLENTSSYKNLMNRQAEFQKVLNTGNQNLIAQYKSDIDQYSKETEQYKKKLQQNKKDLQQYEKDMKKWEKDMEQYQKTYANLLEATLVDFTGIVSAFRSQLLIFQKEEQEKYDIELAKYNAAKEEKLKQYEASQEYFQASQIKYNLSIYFMPDGIPFTVQNETLASGYIYEDLQNKIKEIIKEENDKKQKEVYLNTTGYEQYQNNLEQLRNIQEQKTNLNQQLQQLQSMRSTLPENDGRIESEIIFVQNQINELEAEEIAIGQQCYNYETVANTPQVMETATKLGAVYDKKNELQMSLDVLNIESQQREVVQKNQTILNQSILTTNQNYIKTRSDCAVYYDYLNDIQILRKQGGSEEQIRDLEYVARDWYDHNKHKLIQLEQYEADLEKQKQDYLDNNNFLKATHDSTNRKKDIEKQLAEINQKIEQLESPDVQQRLGVTDQGITYEHGYNFSSTGLYKNLYIDVQKDNEWLILRKRLEELYIYYNNFLEDGQIEEPKTEQEEKQQNNFPILKEDGSIGIFEDKNEDCKCNWFIPMDYEIFGAGLSFLSLKTTVYKTDINGQKIPVYNKEGQFDGFQTQRRQMAVQNGYGYIFTGQYITLNYTGIPGPEPISVMIPGVGLEYGTLLAGGYVALTPYNIYLMKKYPYQNTDPNGQFYWLQTGVLKDAYQTLMGKVPIEVTFKVYKKFPLDCGFPKKCGQMTNEEYMIRGKCGLRQFFEDTHDISTDFDEKSFNIGEFMKQIENTVIETVEGGLSNLTPVVEKATSNLLSNISDLTRFADDKFEKVYNLYEKNGGNVGKRAAQFMETKRNIAEWGNSSYSLACNTWNVADAMGDMNMTRQNAEQKATAIIDKMKGDLFDLIPPECQDTICQTIRETKQDSIKDLGMSVNQNTNTSIETLGNFLQKSWDKSIDALEDKASKIVDGITNTGSAIGNAVINLFDTSKFDFFSLTQYCPRRLADVTKDINPLKKEPQQLPDGTWDVPDSPNVFSQIGGLIGQELIGSVMGALNNCVTRSITNNNINYSSLFPEETRKYLEATNSVGDIANMAKGMGGYKMSLENLFHEANRSSILSNFANVDTNDINLGYLTDFLNERGFSDVIDTDKLLNQTETIDTIKNTLGKAFAGNLQKIQKLKNGQVLSMNDQYKDIVNNNLMQKTQQWADRWSAKTNAVTSIGQNAKSLLDTDFSKAWKNPNQVLGKLQNISNTMNNMLIRERAKQKKQQDELNQAFSASDEIKETKSYILQRWDYLQRLTKPKYEEQIEKQIEKVKNLSINI